MTHTIRGTQTLAHHLSELRKRVMIIGLFFIVAVIAAYQLHIQIISILQAPLDEALYFTAPGGGFNFVLKVCMLVGFLAVSPLILFQTVRFIEPALPNQRLSVLIRYMTASILLLAGGVLFAYFVTLPAALRFLGQFGGPDIHALISANEYMNFVMAYLAGFGLLFQIPIIVLFINRIKPIPPRALLRASRSVIIGAFVMAAILTPTPDPINQGLMAGPIIGMYGLSTGMVLITNKSARRKPKQSAPFVRPFPVDAKLVVGSPPIIATQSLRGTSNTPRTTEISNRSKPSIPRFLDLRPPATHTPHRLPQHTPPRSLLTHQDIAISDQHPKSEASATSSQPPSPRMNFIDIRPPQQGSLHPAE